MNTIKTSSNLAVMPCLTLEISKEAIKNSNFSKTKYKELSLNMMDGIKTCGNAESMVKLVNVVTEWMSEEITWVNEVISFCSSKEDICECVVASNDSVKDIIIIVEDTTQEHVLDYNDYMFEIRKKYDEVNDFMLVDDCMRGVISAMYKESKSIYARG